MKALLLALVVLLAGCSTGPVTTFSVGAAPGVDADAVAEAAAMWNAADERIRVSVSDHPDLTVEWTPGMPANHCGEWQRGTSVLRLNPEMGRSCSSRLTAVIAHEMGHFMAQRTDHVDQPYTLMYYAAPEGATEPTAADVDYVLGVQ